MGYQMGSHDSHQGQDVEWKHNMMVVPLDDFQVILGSSGVIAYAREVVGDNIFRLHI